MTNRVQVLSGRANPVPGHWHFILSRAQLAQARVLKAAAALLMLRWVGGPPIISPASLVMRWSSMAAVEEELQHTPDLMASGTQNDVEDDENEPD